MRWQLPEDWAAYPSQLQCQPQLTASTMIAGFFCCTQTEINISAPCCSIAVFKLGQTCSPNQYYYPSAKLGRYSIGFLHHDFLLHNSQLELTLIPFQKQVMQAKVLSCNLSVNFQAANWRVSACWKVLLWLGLILQHQIAQHGLMVSSWHSSQVAKQMFRYKTWTTGMKTVGSSNSRYSWKQLICTLDF